MRSVNKKKVGTRMTGQKGNVHELLHIRICTDMQKINNWIQQDIDALPSSPNNSGVL